MKIPATIPFTIGTEAEEEKAKQEEASKPVAITARATAFPGQNIYVNGVLVGPSS